MSNINLFTGLPQDYSGDKPYLQMGNQYQTAGIQPTMYQNVDFNIMNYPQNLFYQALQAGNLAGAIPNPLVGIKIQLPDGDTTMPALGWQSANAVGDGLYRVGTHDEGYLINGSLVTEWLASEFRVNYLTAGRVTFATTSGKLTDDAGLLYDAANDLLTIMGLTGGAQLKLAYNASKYSSFLVDSSGDLIVTSVAGAFLFQQSLVGSMVLYLQNTDNTLGSNSGILVYSGTGGDAYYVSGANGQDWGWGIDISDSNSWVLGTNKILGATNAIRVSTALLTTLVAEALSDTTNASINADTDNYAIGAGSSFRLTSNAQRNLTGLTGGLDGKLILLKNIGSNNIVLKHNVTSTAANRFQFSTGTDLVMAPDNSIMVQYDNTTQRWRDVG